MKCARCDRDGAKQRKMSMKEPSEILSMAALRAEIDALDAEIVALMADRARLIDRAAQLKPGEGLPARIDARVEEVVRNARAQAEARGLDPTLIEMIWRQIVEWSIAREERVLGREDGRGLHSERETD